MTKIILHIGPEKCGSSTIQAAITDRTSPFATQVYAQVMDPYALYFLENAQPGDPIFVQHEKLVAQAVAQANTVILSHEMIFKSRATLAKLAAMARTHSEDVTAIAYIRRQSDFLVSCFNQWLFRSPDRLLESSEVLVANGFDPRLFSGVERHLMACLLDGWRRGRQPSGHEYFKWFSTVPKRREMLEKQGVKLQVGLLPRPGFAHDLLQDFAARSGLALAKGAYPQKLQNPGFHPALVEAVVCAIEAGHAMPSPHDANNFFRNNAPDTVPDLQVVERLKAYIDSYFMRDNFAFAAKERLPESYFKPDQQVDPALFFSEMQDIAAKRAETPEPERIAARAARADMAVNAWARFQRNHPHQ